MRRLLIGLVAALVLCRAEPVWAQPTMDGDIDGLSGGTSLVLSLAGVTTGCAVVVFWGQTAAGARTVTGVADDEGTGNSYAEIAGTLIGIGSTRGTVAYWDSAVSAGDGTLTITISFSASIAGNAVAAEVCPSAGGTLSVQTQDAFSQVVADPGTTHYAADSAQIDTTGNVIVMSWCASDGTLGTETDKDGAGSDWAQLESDASNATMGQFRRFSSPQTDERSEMTSSSDRDSWCSVVAIAESGSAVTPRGHLLGILP